MKKIETVAHFGVDENLQKFLHTNYFESSLTRTLAKKILGRSQLKTISIDHHSVITNELLDLFPQLTLLITRSVGLDHVDLDACKARDVAVYHIPDYGAHNIAEHALMLMLAGSRGLTQYTTRTHAGDFSYEGFLSSALF